MNTTKFIQIGGNDGFECRKCNGWFNVNFYDIDHEKHEKKLLQESTVYVCKHDMRRTNCSKCNPYKCPCGSTIANRPWFLKQHFKCVKHRRYMLQL